MKLFLNYKSLLDNKQKIIRVAIVIMLILAALFLFLFRTGNQSNQEMIKAENSEDLTTVQTDTPQDTIIVDVSGEVSSPAVIELPLDSRINDAIQAAGGLTKDADITQINRASILSDGEKIFIPTKQNTAGTGGAGSGQENTQPAQQTGGVAGNAKININSATAAELQTVPGIGPVTANKIIVYRTSKGLFRKLEEIKNVSGIGDKTFIKMEPFICI